MKKNKTKMLQNKTMTLEWNGMSRKVTRGMSRGITGISGGKSGQYSISVSGNSPKKEEKVKTKVLDTFEFE